MSPLVGRRARVGVGVMTVDDQAVFRQAAREVIEATDGFETARRLSAARPASTVVLISTECLEEHRSGDELFGAAAFVRKKDFGPALLRRLWVEHGRRRLAPDGAD